MTRAEFIQHLQRGLRGVPTDALAAIVLDYQGYFDDGIRAGRSEADLAHALGDPRRLSSELRFEIDSRQWEADRTLTAGRRVAAGGLGLAALDALLFVPLSLVVILCVAGILATVTIALAGCYVLIVSPFDEPLGGLLAALLRGVGLIAAGVAGTAGLLLAAIWLVDALAWYGRVHRRTLTPLLPRALVSTGEYS